MSVVVSVWLATLMSAKTNTPAMKIATIPAGVGVPSLSNLGNAVSLIPLSCISLRRSLYKLPAFLSRGFFLVDSRSNEAAFRYVPRLWPDLASNHVAWPANRRVVCSLPSGSMSRRILSAASPFPLVMAFSALSQPVVMESSAMDTPSHNMVLSLTLDDPARLDMHLSRRGMGWQHVERVHVNPDR